VDLHPYRSRTASPATRTLAGVYLRLWSAKEALLYSTPQSKRARLENPSQSDMRVHTSAHASAAPAQASVPPIPSAPAQVPASSPISSPSLNIQQPTTYEEDMRDLRAAAAASLAESQVAAHKHEQIQMELDSVMHASGNSSSLHLVSGPSTASGTGASASGSGLGSQECTQNEIQDLQTPDITLPLDPRDKAIYKSMAKCDRGINYQKAAWKGTGPASSTSPVTLVVPLVVSPAVLSVLSAETINAHDLASQATQTESELIQMELDPVMNVFCNPLSIPLVHGSSKPSGNGASASELGVGSQECSQDEIQDLQTPDITFPLDPRIKAINNPNAQCDTYLLQQRSAFNGTGPTSALSAAALLGSPNFFPVDSYDSIHAQKNLLPAADTYEGVLDYWATQIQLPHDFAEQTIFNSRANSAFQSAQRQCPGKSQVTLAFPSSKALASQLQIQMMFIALLNNKKGRVGMDTMCQGSGFLTQAFCEAASPQIPLSLVSNDPNIKTLPSVTTGNGRIGTAVGFAHVQMIIGGFVSDVEFVVFGKFAGFDAVLGQDWLRHHQCILDMGTGMVTITTDNRKFVISSIDTKN
jgi:hypothetical protein